MDRNFQLATRCRWWDGRGDSTIGRLKQLLGDLHGGLVVTITSSDGFAAHTSRRLGLGTTRGSCGALRWGL